MTSKEMLSLLAYAEKRGIPANTMQSVLNAIAEWRQSRRRPVVAAAQSKQLPSPPAH